LSLIDTFSLAQDHSQCRAVATAAEGYAYLTDMYTGVDNCQKLPKSTENSVINITVMVLGLG